MSKNLSKGYQSSVYFRSHCEQERCISTLDSNFQTWTEKSNILGIMPGEDLMGLKHCFSPSNKVLGALIQCAVAHLIFPTLNLLYCIWPNRRMGCEVFPLLQSGLQGGLCAGMYFTLEHTDSIWSSEPLNHLREEMFISLYLYALHVHVWYLCNCRRCQISMTLCCRNCNELYRYVRKPCVPEGLRNSNEFGIVYSMFA